jgi:excisionase family DNA binding protein
VTEPWLSVDDAAAYLSVSTKSVRRRAAELGGVRFGNRLLFRASAIDRFLETQSLGPRRARGGGRLRPVS